MVNPLKILLVEDSEEDAELLFLEFRRGGLKVDLQRVETAEDFENRLSQEEWDLVLSDYNLPTFNAPSALKIFNSYEKDIPFIITSGAVASDDVVTLLKAGAHDFLEKNDLARLIPAIEREVREAHIRKDQRIGEQTLKKLYRAVEQSPVSVLITDAKGVVEYVNQSYLDTTGYTKSEIIGKLPDVLAGEFVSLQQNAEIWDCVRTDREWRSEFCNQRKNGEFFWEHVTVSPIKDDHDELTNILISKEDITFRKETEETLYRQTNYDVLTKLPNRTLLSDRLTEVIKNNESAALISIDVDDFKKVNESLGHEYGDLLLVSVAKRIEGCLSLDQTCGRVSGDEFAVIAPNVSSLSQVEHLVQKIVEAFRHPYEIKDHEVFSSVSVGASIYPEDGVDGQTLFRNSEAAMRRAKEGGRNQFRYFSADMNDLAQERLALEGGLRRALENREIKVFYQPIVEAATGLVAGMEALVRWDSPEHGLVSPDKFIPLAEETGLIVPIGTWVLNEACLAIRELATICPEAYVAVNVSSEQVWAGTLVEEVNAALKRHEVGVNQLVLEVTESVCLEDTETTYKTFKELSELGVRLAVDDFGTGYSSLSYLKKYPFDILKIDRAFVSDLPDDEDNVALVQAMGAMAHSLGLKIVAEGVETAEQVSFLNARQCDLLQGFHFSRPVPFDQFLVYDLVLRCEDK